jgi:hypothetical protein
MIEEKMRRRIKKSKDSVFFPSDFFDLGSRTQVFYILKKLQSENTLIRVGKGIYTRARISSLTKKPIPEKSIREIAECVLRRVGIRVIPTKFEQSYNSGISTQVPTGLVIGVNRKVARKIGFNGRFIQYEKVTER